MYLIVGATGMVGSEICRSLTEAGKPVRSLVRATSDLGKVEALQDCGAEVVQGDLRDRASLEAACQGVTAVISTASSMPFSYEPGVNDIHTVDTEGQMNLIEAAKAANVEHMVYISFTMDNEFPLRNAKRAVEERLKDSGMAYTILRPSYFMEVWLSPAVGFDAAGGKAQIYGSGENPLSLISFADVAQFAVASLDHREARNATLAIGGPQALSQLEVVRTFEEVGGRPLEVKHVSEEALAEQQGSATDPMQQSFSGLMRWYAQGDPVDMEKPLQVFPVHLTTVREYAQRTLSAA